MRFFTRFFIFALFFLLLVQSQARVEVLFHPYDPTLETIARWIAEAKETVDIAMYNMDLKPDAPVIVALSTPEMQARIRSGELRIRVNLELYGTPVADAAKRQALEDLGVDVRYLGRSAAVHHKFAVIDAHGVLPRVITGSANWSVMSAKGYNENILFFTQEPEATARYSQEFNRIWDASREFGVSLNYPVLPDIQFIDQQDLEIVFNSPRILGRPSIEKSSLTQEVVRLIQSSKKSLQIASTRIRLTPVLEALYEAAERGVLIEAVIGQDDYRDLGRRAKYLSHKNIQLRVKIYSLKLNDFLRFQMHHKYMIVDGVTLVTGSFNWSKSSEFNHIENIVILSGVKAQEVVPAYLQEFATIWSFGRDQYDAVLLGLKKGEQLGCSLPQMVLTPQEIEFLQRYKTDCW